MNDDNFRRMLNHFGFSLYYLHSAHKNMFSISYKIFKKENTKGRGGKGSFLRQTEYTNRRGGGR